MSVYIYVSLVRRRVETPTPHYTITCVKLTIVTNLSFSERLAIANLSQLRPRRNFDDFPLISSFPADHVPDWEPRALLDVMVEVRSVNVENTLVTQY